MKFGMSGKKVTAMLLAGILAVPSALGMCVATGTEEVEAEAAPEELLRFDFENGLEGLESAGMGAAPVIVEDPMLGKVLQFADGEQSALITQAQDPTMDQYSIRWEVGTPSALKFENPYKGKTLSGATISYWVKGSAAASEAGAGLIGFISKDRTDDHPDKKSGAPEYQDMEPGTGPYVLGITCGSSLVLDSPIVNFDGLFRNTYYLNDDNGNLSNEQWHYVVVSLQNGALAENCGSNITKVFIDGKDILGHAVADRRYNDGEVSEHVIVNGMDTDQGQPALLDFLSWDDVTAYIGETGRYPTRSDVYMDDLTFYEGAVNGAEARLMYEEAVEKISGSVIAGVDEAADGSGSPVEIVMEEPAGESAEAAEALQSEGVLAKVLGEDYTGDLKLAGVKVIRAQGDVTYPLTVKFRVVGVTAGSKAYVLQYINGAWEKTEAVAGNGTVAATVTSLSPAAIVIERQKTRYGDVDGDGRTTVLDALQILKDVTGSAGLTEEQKNRADVNLDEKADVQDALYVLKYVVRSIKELPVRK